MPKKCKKSEGVNLTYVPHGIDEKVYKPLSKDSTVFNDFKAKHFTQINDDSFVLLFNSRNIQRKRTSDLIMGYKYFIEDLKTEEEKNNCYLILHTDTVDPNGTDLPEVVKNCATDANVIFSSGKLTAESMNMIYNIADVTCNPSSAEGFGLSHMESLMAGTPTIATVLGGLQDQMGFKKDDGSELKLEDYKADWPSNSNGKYKDCGSWVYPLWPQLNLVGSPVTPYIYDSRVSIDQITNGIKYWYNMSKIERSKFGKLGREWAIKNDFTAHKMVSGIIDSIEKCLDNFKPRKRFSFEKLTNNDKINYPVGDIR